MSNGPATVLIIRHGEKPGDPATENPTDGVNLSTRGYERAAALSVYVPATFGKLDFLFATQASKHSNRPVETITPLAKALGLPIDDKHADNDYAQVAKDVRTHPKYAGKIVLVCWHHGKIPELCSALGGAVPVAHWAGSVFDRVWRIDYPIGGVTTGLPVQNIPQQLLYGDSAT